ncbi:hypothetical protein CA600_05150 [Paenibacillus sp. VTT E-133280]|jgi:hypothetical protein|uniref:Uncharacterized protein n=3 Tax=Paenibacillaceae TaxID=186822 RepID=A0A7Z2ZQH9_9BACL|nr:MULTISPECIES: hypothetical protein [Paenibacillaceae]KKC47778.1 hypothetical protein VE23_12750 [Paenibacillus sp. D9]MCK8487479.1 hypothetical protein [Paenibacillus mellifer]MCT1400926.1 hypothetical protein [Paenibacillus sp. p3-SID867]OZQ68811.1 hypothetical protein CA600_05150 [Paenibacillus sp. VTT E-133280]QJD88551.1 hypothetical protein HH215_35480 [Cohnella herbarum]
MSQIHIQQKGEGFSIILLKQTTGIRQEFGYCTGYCESVVFALEKAKQLHIPEQNILYQGRKIGFFAYRDPL